MYLMPIVTNNIESFKFLIEVIKKEIEKFEYIHIASDKFDYSEKLNDAYKIILFEYDFSDENYKEKLKQFRLKNSEIIIVVSGEEFNRIERILFLENNIYYIDKWKDVDEKGRFITQLLLNKVKITYNFPKKNWFEFTINSIQQFSMDVAEFIANLSMQTPLSKDDVEAIGIILTEIQNNAIEHGNKFDELKKIKISGAILSNSIIIKIDDEGAGFDTSKLINPLDDLDKYFKEREAQNKRPGGFGIAMANKIMDSITFNEKGNSLIMTKYF
ncbi:MAG TPA: ATP-binding protein [bacterium]|nr:ATP-binding protein [bacterium]